MIKALVFDFDGLIMDTETPEVEGWQAIYAEYGQEFPLQIWVRDVVGATMANFDPAAYLVDVTGHPLDQVALHSQVHTYRLKVQSKLSALPGVADCIHDAKRLGLRLAVASSSDHDWVEGYLHQLGLFDEFEVIICREDAKRLKPAPDLFLAALDALRIGATEALVFEDSPNGVRAAKSAGIFTVAVPLALMRHLGVDGADVILPSLASLRLEELLAKYFPSM